MPDMIDPTQPSDMKAPNARKARTAAPSAELKGVITIPGDKSISHRAMLLGALAQGTTTVTGLLEGDDVLRSATAMRQLGADIERHVAVDGSVTWEVTGTIAGEGGQSPQQALYFGNAGTGVRLAMGLIAGLGIGARFDGDASLRSRPMNRILTPLREMGVMADAQEGRLPIALQAGQKLKAIEYTLPVPSAQIKSAILLAGLHAEGITIIDEPVLCRDHTENMLRAFGVDLNIKSVGGGRRITLKGGQSLSATTIEVPGDPSSAAFLIAAGLIVPDSDITIKNVLMNPMRTGFLTTVQEMGGQIELSNSREEGGEPVADIRVQTSALKGVRVPTDRAPAMIDEYPILSVVAAFADGETFMPGIGEMRVKESDRIAACEAGLRANKVDVESGEDWLRVRGNGAAPMGGGEAATFHDHRIAMAFLIMGLATQTSVSVDDITMVDTSFPEFFEIMESLGAEIF